MILKSTSEYRSFLNPDASVTISIRTDDQVHSVRAETEASSKVFGDFESKFQIVLRLLAEGPDTSESKLPASTPVARPTNSREFIDTLATLDAHLVSQAEMDFEAFVDMQGEAYL